MFDEAKEARIRPVILCGGSGTRLWPASRESMPKQFAVIFGDRSTFQETLIRVSDPAIFARPVVVTNKAHRFLAEKQMKDIGIEADVILEPVARDSGPAILAASLFLEERTPGALAIVLAADHLVRDVEGFRTCVKQGVKAAQAGRIVTFGIQPTQPATGYGYIEAGAAVEGSAQEVRRFVEKPDAATAMEYLNKGYLWNSGNFLFAPATVIAHYQAADAASVDLVRQAIAKADVDLDALELQQEAFEAARKISFDYAVMEKTQSAAVVPGAFGWSDIGGWDALWDMSDKDENGNALQGRVTVLDSANNYVSSEDRLVTLLGVEDMVVVSTHDAVLVASRESAPKVKNLVEKMRASDIPEANTASRMYRPWGWYQTLEMQGRFQVKRIVVYPGGRLSLQKHFHRAEHWVVVRGTARVTVGDIVKEMTENQSAYIPLGAVHRLENPGKIDVEIIEVQTGAYLGEDDIVRIEDVYNRT
ncbi:MAG: mannose-1-phosphate guanylyltransferase/mannose-6-phosphate isomerase [Proteobacteria bacterium]|nr:mannose-1-phosphate guanylyltransferase/mannose-6-phosphate isomerase [Pseudomonadota bacterium]